MKYLKALFFSFLVIFFANHILPGIVVTNQTKIPHFGSDIPFALALGFLNAFIYPALRGLRGNAPMYLVIAIAIAMNFAAYGCVALFNFGIHINSFRGYLFVSSVVTIASCLANYFEMKGAPKSPSHEPPSHNEE